MTKGYSIFEWIPGTPITDKDDETQNEEYEVASKMKACTMMTTLKCIRVKMHQRRDIRR